MSLLSVQNLSVQIGEMSVLDTISFALGSGDILALTGESGSGKSMTALALMQLLPQAAVCSGSIQLDGREMVGLDDPALCKLRGAQVSMVFQEPMTALNPVKTIGTQVMETLLEHGMAQKAQARQRARQVLERVGLPAAKVPMSSYPHQLSGGQRQRVVIAMALICEPNLLIADEPTTALDVTIQAQILDLIKELQSEMGMAVIMITHDLAVVADMADDIAVMQSGKIVEQASPDTLFTAMQHPYTKALFAASSHQVNLPLLPPDPPPLLEVKNVTRSYRLPRRALWEKPALKPAVRGLSFSLRRGERLGLVGESGCGKSTLTRAILGLDPIDSGDIRLNGQSLQGAGADLRRDIQVVFQDPYGSFNPRHKVGRLIREPYHLLPQPPTPLDQDDAVVTVLKAVGLRAEDQFKYIHEFSGGQRQRIAIARALIIRPKLVIFDEAVSALDVSVRAQILDLIAALAEDYGLSYLFISHDLSVVRTITDRCLVMQNGEIVEHGQTAAILDNPQHSYSQELIAAAPKLPRISIGA
ncbi:MAG: ABC transporter ATP-binding protein [Paracoccaceae bacterium]